MNWQSGAQLGAYELVAPLGAGGMGEVWKARDPRVDRIVAIKRLKAEHAERFRREARAIAALNHPHICQLYDVGPDYLVMEFVEGAPLKGPIPVEEAVKLAIQIVSALEEAHGRGIVHRDLKPDNILISGKGAKLLDFGLAKIEAATDDPTMSVALTGRGVVVGTAAYMSPEQAQGQQVDARSDGFSFGVVLYEMLSGERPFRGDTSLAVLSSIVRDDPPPLEALPALDRIVRRCLAKQPAVRYQTMSDLRSALEQVALKPPGQQRSIAVLPFSNMSRDPDDEYFSDGLTEELINLLAHLPGLKVTARTSAFAFRGKEQDIRRIAEALSVRTILEGSVRRAGSRVRVTAQLIDAEDGFHLWSERYDRELTDIFAIQDEIAQAIADALQVRLATAPQRYTPNLRAYEAYLKGRHYLCKLSPEALPRAREYLEQSAALDPRFALAHAALGEYFMWQGFVVSPPVGEAHAAALRALDIDATLPDAHAVLGTVAAVYGYDWEEAGRRFRLAMSSQPVSSQVRHLYAKFYLLPVGRRREAVAELERALREDPLNVVNLLALAECLRAEGQSIEAEAAVRRILEVDENFWPAYYHLGELHALNGRPREGLVFAEKAYALAKVPYTIALLAGLLVQTGETGRADAVLRELGDGSAYGAPTAFATFCLLCSKVDEALEWFEKIVEQRHPHAVLFPSLSLRIFRVGLRGAGCAGRLNLPVVAM